jgi:hypothetical protein
LAQSTVPGESFLALQGGTFFTSPRVRGEVKKAAFFQMKNRPYAGETLSRSPEMR